MKTGRLFIAAVVIFVASATFPIWFESVRDTVLYHTTKSSRCPQCFGPLEATEQFGKAQSDSGYDLAFCRNCKTFY